MATKKRKVAEGEIPPEKKERPAEETEEVVIPAKAMKIVMWLVQLPGYLVLDFNTLKVSKHVVNAIKVLKKLELLDLPSPVEQMLLRMAYNHRDDMAVHYPQLLWHLSFDRDRLLPPPDHLILQLTDE